MCRAVKDRFGIPADWLLKASIHEVPRVRAHPPSRNSPQRHRRRREGLFPIFLNYARRDIQNAMRIDEKIRF